ncbi:hypothetical protein [Mesorhizobium sp. B2-3-5]|uniref:hypothetical protein n=1 Tax=Mesorhizobium sp. B2-3-5 TaxID=2589958 RepID=UPI00112DF45E|nr:hypothetical protein [Mesorhizobium sp. B2-3-5]TPM18154.1 hypothetical protein FJ958_28100 [Mesorhizobium sp. B2-3-5]
MTTSACEDRIIMLTPAATDTPMLPRTVARYRREMMSGTVGTALANGTEFPQPRCGQCHVAGFGPR